MNTIILYEDKEQRVEVLRELEYFINYIRDELVLDKELVSSMVMTVRDFLKIPDTIPINVGATVVHRIHFNNDISFSSPLDIFNQYVEELNYYLAEIEALRNIQEEIIKVIYKDEIIIGLFNRGFTFVSGFVLKEVEGEINILWFK